MLVTTMTASERHEHDTTRSKRHRIARACDVCQRRKERCNGVHPCARCTERRIQSQCHFSPFRKRKRKEHRSSIDDETRSNNEPLPENEHLHGSTEQAEALPTQQSPESPLERTRLIRDSKGRCMFIGDSANLSFLQGIRRLVESCIGSCSFVDDPLRYLMVEASPDELPRGFDPSDEDLSSTISLDDARHLINRYLLATNCVLDLFDGSYLLQHVGGWINDQLSETAPPSPVYCLVLAIGAQMGPEDRDALAARLFNRGRYLTSQSFMEDASIRTIQLYALMTMYLLGACRRNAAFMYLGTAVRAAYAIGLHQKEIATVLGEFEERERLWKVLRILDLFMSASLGRPPSTNETRDTTAEEGYSASTDLCAIFELILTDVYSKRSVSTAVLSNIGAKHRKWAAKFFEGLSTDKIAPTELIEDGTTPNIGLLHVKEAYYWTIILLTRPFLSEAVTLHAQKAMRRRHEAPQPCTAAFDTNHGVLVNACVDSAIRTVELLQPLLEFEGLPKRLPFVVNSLFIACLVLGCAFFGDLYQSFPLGEKMKLGRDLLARFKHDAIAQRNAAIIGFLLEASVAWLEQRNAQRLHVQGRAVGVMFGQIHRPDSQAPTRGQTPQTTANGAMPSDTTLATHTLATLAPNASLPDGEGRAPNVPDLADMLTSIEDFASMPYPVMEPHTIHFDPYGDTLPLFLTVSDAYSNYSNV